MALTHCDISHELKPRLRFLRPLIIDVMPYKEIRHLALPFLGNLNRLAI